MNIINKLAENDFVIIFLKYIVRGGLFLFLLFFLFQYIISHWYKIINYDFDISITYLCLSFLATFIFLGYHSFVWGVQVRSSGFKIQILKASAGALIANIGKYLPGKVWTVIGRAHFLKDEGYRASECNGIAFLSQIISIISSFVFVFAFVPFFIQQCYTQILIAVIVLVIFLIIFSHPLIYFRLLNFFLRMFKKKEIYIYLPYHKIVFWLLLNLFTGILSGAAFSLFVLSIVNVSIGDLPILIGTNALAGVIGLISIFTPGGLGVKEGILLIILPNYIGVEPAFLVSVGHRLVLVISELFCAFFAYSYLKGFFRK